MTLALDIGNTNIKAGIFQNESILDFNIFSDDNSFYSFIENNPPDEVVISSVVPAKTGKITGVLKTKFKITPFVITNNLKFDLTIGYKNQEGLGTDRICAVEGAFYLFRNSENYKLYNENVFILAIDLGTANTINVIKYPGEFIGGSISPGIKMMLESLNSKTAQLPLVEIDDYKDFIANDTKSSIAAGVVASVVGMIEKTISHLQKEKSAKKVFVYITGGNAKRIIPYLNFDFLYEEGLVLYGINALYKLNKKIL